MVIVSVFSTERKRVVQELLSYAWLLCKRFGAQCYRTWTGRVLFSAITAAFLYVFTREDPQAWKNFKLVLLAAGFALALFAVCHLLRTPLLVHRREACDGAGEDHWLFGVVGVAMLAALTYFLGAYGRKPWTPPTGFVIRYQEAPLNHQTISLMTPTDRTRRSLRMSVDPNYPTMFVVTGISIRNEGSRPLQPDVAYLSFSARVDKWQSNSGVWEPSPDRNINGWSTYRMTFYRGLIEPGHPLDLLEFSGTPVPSGPTRVKVSVVYGLEETTAEFTLKPPST
jgi:hypothetical protein